MKGKYQRKSSRTERAYKTILWAAAILKLINEAAKLIKNIFD